MRIFAPQLGLNPDSSSGGEVYDVKILTGLAERGHSVDVLLRKGQIKRKEYPEVENLNKHNSRFFNIPNWPISFKGTSFYSYLCLQYIFQFEKSKLIKSADIFRVHMPYSIALNAWIFKFVRRIMGLPCPQLWFHYHHIEDETQMRIFKCLAKYADGITVDNHATIEDLEKICPGVKNKFYRVINIGTDTDIFRPDKPDTKLKSKLGIKKDDKVVLFVGHLVHRKGIDILMESWEKIRKDFKDIHLVLIGRGDIPGVKNSLENLVKEYERKDENIHHKSRVSTQKDLVKYYNIADVFAFPTRLEGHGMTAAEAMSCGVPVVTTNAKGVRDIVVDGKTGYRVDVDDAEQFTEKLKILLSDDSLRKRMGHAARRHIEKNWTWDVSIDQTERFMQKVVNRK